MGSTATATEARAATDGATVKETGDRNYKFERVGDDFLFGFPSYAIAVGIQGLHESRGEPQAEIWVKSTLPDASGHLAWGRQTLSSLSQRESLTGILRKRVKDVPWALILETAFTKAVMEYRNGNPVLNLARLPKREHARFLISKLILSSGLTMLFGDGGTCKSIVALAVAAAVKTGTALPNGLRPLTTGNVLYVDYEVEPEVQQERLEALTLGLHLEDVPEIHWWKPTRNIAHEAPRLRAEIDKLKAALVIIDSVGPAIGGNLRDEENVIPAMNAINGLRVPVLGLAHMSKSDTKSDGGTGSIFGSIFFRNLARSAWEIRRSESQPSDIAALALYHRKMNFGPQFREPLGFKLTFCGTEASTDMIEFEDYDAAIDADLAEHMPLKDRLRALLARGGKTVDELVDATGATDDAVRKSLRRVSDFTIIEGGKGRGNIGRWGLRSMSYEME